MEKSASENGKNVLLNNWLGENAIEFYFILWWWLSVSLFRVIKIQKDRFGAILMRLFREIERVCTFYFFPFLWLLQFYTRVHWTRGSFMQIFYGFELIFLEFYVLCDIGGKMNSTVKVLPRNLNKHIKTFKVIET